VIEKFFTQPKTLSRLHSGIFGPHLPVLASTLDEAKYVRYGCAFGTEVFGAH